MSGACRNQSSYDEHGIIIILVGKEKSMDKKILGQIQYGQTYAVIPARSGSKGVKNKNIRCLNGHPLMAYSIAAAKLCPSVSRILVSTDSVQYTDIARHYGAEAPFLRPKELAEDQSTDIEFMEHLIGWLSENEKAVPEFFVHLRPTHPLRDTHFITRAIEKMQRDGTATSLRSAYVAANTPYKWFQMGEEQYFESIVKGQTLDEANNPRQAYPDVYVPDGYVDILRTSFIVESGLLHGDRMIGYVVPCGIDIDAGNDLEYLEYYLKTHRHDLAAYLDENYTAYDGKRG